MLDTATSSKTIYILAYYMNKIYSNNNLEIENFDVYMHALVYKNLVSDYKKINIKDNTLLKFIINDFNEVEANKNFVNETKR